MSENAYLLTGGLALCTAETIIYTTSGRRSEVAMEPDTQAEILQRLRTTEGHLRAIIKMTETGRRCEEVLHQLNALQGGLRATTIQIIRCQIQSSQVVILENSSPGRRIAEVKRLQSFCTFFMHYSNYPDEVMNE